MRSLESLAAVNKIGGWIKVLIKNIYQKFWYLPRITASLQFRRLAQPLPHGLFVGEILVFLLFRGRSTKHANHGMLQDAVNVTKDPTNYILLVRDDRLDSNCITFRQNTFRQFIETTLLLLELNEACWILWCGTKAYWRCLLFNLDVKVTIHVRDDCFMKSHTCWLERY